MTKRRSLRRAAWALRTVGYHAAYNALTAHAPRVASALQRLTGDTGRGRDRDGAAAADYFEAVMRDYDIISPSLVRGRRVLELGPGDTRAIALIARLDGAVSWEGYDPFDIQSRRESYLGDIYRPILERRFAAGNAISLLDTCTVSTTPEALRARGRRFDVVLSRAVLEHVRDLEGLFELVAPLLEKDAILVHKIDLRCHGITFDHPLDFLRFSDRTWDAMSSHIDLPNRVRASAYLALGERVGLRTVWAASTHTIDAAVAEACRASLAPRFRAMSAEDLTTLGLWLVQVGPAHPRTGSVSWPLGPAPRERLSAY